MNDPNVWRRFDARPGWLIRILREKLDQGFGKVVAVAFRRTLRTRAYYVWGKDLDFLMRRAIHRIDMLDRQAARDLADECLDNCKRRINER